MEGNDKRSYEQDRVLDRAQLETIFKNAKGNTLKHDFAIRLNDLLRINGMTQEALANKTSEAAKKYKSNASISTASMSDYINGKALPNSEKAILMADALGVSCDELLRGIKSENLSTSEKTGLSNKAIDVISNQTSPELKEVLSRFIESAELEELLTGISNITNQKKLYNQYVIDLAQKVSSADDFAAIEIIVKTSAINDVTISENNNASAGSKLTTAKEYVDVLCYKLANVFERLASEITYSQEFETNKFERVIQLINSEKNPSVNQVKINCLKLAKDGSLQKKLNPQITERMKDKRNH